MENKKRIWVILTLFLTIAFTLIAGNTYATDAKLDLSIKAERPYSADGIKNDSTSGDDVYTFTKGAVNERLWKIYNIADKDYVQPFYCLRGGLGFGTSNSVITNVKYSKIADMKTSANNAKKELKRITGVEISNENYNSILWIADNMYLPKDENAENMREELLFETGKYFYIKNSILPRVRVIEVFKTLTDEEIINIVCKYAQEEIIEEKYSVALQEFEETTTLATIQNYGLIGGINKVGEEQIDKNVLTDDDIEVIQQMAIWYYTNYDTNGIEDSYSFSKTTNIGNKFSVNGENLSGTRAEQAASLYEYFIGKASCNSKEYIVKEIIVPTVSIEKTEPRVELLSSQYKIGPFKIVETGNIDYNIDINLKDFKGTTISKTAYTIELANGGGRENTAITTLEDAIGQGEFYISLAKTYAESQGYDLSTVKMSLAYNYGYYTTTATLWTATENDQPVVSVSKERISGDGNDIISTAEVVGQFAIKILKEDKVTGKKINGAIFDLKDNNRKNISLTDNKDGTFITSYIDIEENGQEFTYTLKEAKAPEGYIGYDGDIKIKVDTEKDGKQYVIKDAYFIDETGNKVTLDLVKIDFTQSEVKVIVKNTIIEGKYSINLQKLIKDTQTGLANAQFEVEYLDNSGEKITKTITTTVTGDSIVNDREILDDGEIHIYKFTETKVPTNEDNEPLYKKLDKSFILEITTGLNTSKDKYVVKSAKILDMDNKEIISNAIKAEETETTVLVKVENEKITGMFNVNLQKLIANTKTMISGAKFKLEKVELKDGKYVTQEVIKESIETSTDGNLIISKTITAAGQTYIYRLTEIEAPKGYALLKEAIIFKVVTDIKNNEYFGTAELISGPAKVDNADEIKVIVENEPLEGTYTINLKKVLEGTLEGLSGIKFKLEEFDKTTNKYKEIKEVTTTGNVDNLISAKEITEEATYTYRLTESYIPVDASNNPLYEGIEPIILKITTKLEGTVYKVTAEIEAHDMAEISISGSVITITAKNRKTKSFDLALRKFITSVNGKNVEISREPEIKTADLKAKKTTTATYSHSKEPIVVKQGDIVKYTIRIYNEGELDGYATKVTDYLPKGLGLLVDYNENLDNGWVAPSESTNLKTVKLIGDLYDSEEKVTNLKIEDFYDIDSLKDVTVIAGSLPISTQALHDDLIKGYDSELTEEKIEKDVLWQKAEDGTDGLYYRDLEVTCIVLAKNTYTGSLVNVAEITEDKAINNGVTVELSDRDSTPKNVDLEDYDLKEENSTYQEDDDDYEILELKYFDLALRKFITKVNDTVVDTRIPKVIVDDKGNITYEHDKTPVYVYNNDEVTYTIRVYNEGTLSGFVNEITDDMPEGLEFLPENETNKEYGWKMYYIDKNGKVIETTELEKATMIKTDCLSETKSEVAVYTNNEEKMELSESNELKAFDRETMKTPDYKEVKVTFKVSQENIPENSGRIIVNKAHITEDSDYDEDSIPNEWNEGEDDQDYENVYVKYFDLSLLKWVTTVIVTEDSKTTTTQTGFTPYDNPEPIAMAVVNKKKINSTTVKFVYRIQVKNEGEIEGYATEITDYIPKGLKFVASDNPLWTKGANDTITTRALETKLLKPGETATVDVTFTWINSSDNLGLKTNIAEISEDYNEKDTPDVDSEPDNVKITNYTIEQEDDDDFALVILSLKTGEEIYPLIVLITSCLAILCTGVVLIKKYVVM